MADLRKGKEHYKLHQKENKADESYEELVLEPVSSEFMVILYFQFLLYK